ncbi:hypothetical protein EDEG_01543 [Edhazardia aedis USNM 41457]|uniref:Uncharacterized protein n=1 Tax=Edhazardia aedis (strain USNM 41457) TaxID=1003232 RepID=J8ZWX1_EDHAE|nr:hypothetical protein EDEG_01543 [Edhazardia aedis USNM 41457]|eukprot:EJW04168.1 hypothetical protein EDEG_01543 [Edhazardia aedis USNM 41457]
MDFKKIRLCICALYIFIVNCSDTKKKRKKFTLWDLFFGTKYNAGCKLVSLDFAGVELYKAPECPDCVEKKETCQACRDKQLKIKRDENGKAITRGGEPCDEHGNPLNGDDTHEMECKVS